MSPARWRAGHFDDLTEEDFIVIEKEMDVWNDFFIHLERPMKILE
jgi:hypothetical protein